VTGFQRYAANLRPFLETVLQGIAGLIKGLAQLAANREFVMGLAAGFRALGNLLLFVAKQAGQFAAWMGEIASATNVITFLSRVAALVTTIFDRVLKLVGIDLAAWLNPRVVVGFFEKLWGGIEGGIRLFFALGRTSAEVFRIIQSFIQDVQDRFADLTENAQIGFRRLFEDFQYEARKAALEFSKTFQSTITFVMEGLYTAFSTLTQGLPQLAQAMGITPQGLQKFAEGIAQIGSRPVPGAVGGMGADIANRFDPDRTRLRQERQAQLAGRTAEDFGIGSRRGVRETLRMEEDPRRRMSPLSRIGGAFSGQFGRPGEGEFFADLEARRQAFAGFFSAAPSSPSYQPPSTGSVTTVPGVTTPAYPYGQPGFPGLPGMTANTPTAQTQVQNAVTPQTPAAAAGGGTTLVFNLAPGQSDEMIVSKVLQALARARQLQYGR
jgi:hypothetical protein